MNHVRHILKPVYYLFRGLLWLGIKHQCPVCGWGCRSFLPYHGDYARNGAVCPHCGSLERHRFLWLFLQKKGLLDVASARVLHIAPEEGLRMRLSGRSNLKYQCIDLASNRKEEQVDVTDMPFRDGSFDLVICSHVLEHVGNDRTAIREISRVLKPSGLAILMVPALPGLAQTKEDPGIKTEEGRKAAFGQSDHVRIYGNDVVKRFEGLGMVMREVRPDALVSKEEALRFSLRADDPIYECLRQ